MRRRTRRHGLSGLAPHPLPLPLVLTPESRRPTRLPATTVTHLMRLGPASVPVRQRVTVRPQASVVIVTQSNLIFLKVCLTSVLANTPAPSVEVIVVDNGSTDGTADYVQALARVHQNVRLIRNAENLGFAAGTNQGLREAAGDTLVLLNDDTIVTPGWLTVINSYLDEPHVGLVGPVTNRAGNECQIDTSYATYGELLEFARQRQTARRGGGREVAMLTMFCLALRRDTFERIGPLDEQFGLGMFEDDDYSLRARRAGYRIVCAEDSFVHHFGATSLGKLANEGRFGTLFEENRRRFEHKWQASWLPHRRPIAATYRSLIDRVRHVIEQHVPAELPVAVVSRGDDALLDLPGREAWHFPQDAGGGYAGYNPANSEEAIAFLSGLRKKGLEHFVIPQTARWWLDYYQGFRAHLETISRRVVEDSACVLYMLRTEAPPDRNAAARRAASKPTVGEIHGDIITRI